MRRGSRRVDLCTIEIEEGVGASRLQVHWLRVRARGSPRAEPVQLKRERQLLCSQTRTKSCFNQGSSYLWWKCCCAGAFAEFCPVKQHRHCVLLCACVHRWCQQCVTCRPFTKTSSAPAVSRENRTGFICFDTPDTPRVYTSLNSTAQCSSYSIYFTSKRA